MPGSDENGWGARLTLELSRRGEKSVVSHSSQQGPLTIQQPFYPEGDLCHLYLLHPPAGIVGGDRLQLQVQVKEHAAALLTTPGATKFYRTDGRRGEQHQQFTLCSGASLEWLPQETIYFPDADAVLSSSVHLQGSARWLGWEIHCLGLPVNGRDFADGKARISFSIYRDGEPLLLESLSLSPEKRRCDDAFLRGNPVFATFSATGGDPALLEQVRLASPRCDKGSYGVTLVEDLLLVRYLGQSTIEAKHLFLRAWETLRPQTTGRAAVRPRIWAT